MYCMLYCILYRLHRHKKKKWSFVLHKCKTFFFAWAGAGISTNEQIIDRIYRWFAPAASQPSEGFCLFQQKNVSRRVAEVPFGVSREKELQATRTKVDFFFSTKRKYELG